ncbi:MAG: DUF3179 domain-containing protein [Planctomycetes bacterium]|nr:DUF3179 domain-containing protein [Planctomycetota bacterium]
MHHLLAAVIIAGTPVAYAPGSPGQEPALVARPDAFPTLVNPMCSHCRDEAKRRAKELRDDEPVLCWIRGYSDGGVIPHRFFLNTYRVISDTYGVFVFDADAGYSRGFAPSLDFTFHGWRNGVMVMKHKDGTLYSCLTGVAFDGPRKGDQLKTVPTLVSNWGHWLKEYPQAVAYHMFDKYQPVETPAKPSSDSMKSRGPADKRLPPENMVLGVRAGKESRAFPIDIVAKAGLVNDTLDGKSVVVLWHEPTRTAVAYRPIATPPGKKAGGPRTLALEREGDCCFVDKETKSRWDIAGRATAGELKDWTLEWLDGVQVKWFAWAAELPETSVYQPPKESAKQTDAIKEIAGTAEFLKAIPKKFGVLQEVDSGRSALKLLIDGDKEPTSWLLTPDAEVKVQGWWGRLEQLQPGDRVWAWFKLDRKKQPSGIFMLADEISQTEINGKADEKLAPAREKQKAWLRERWNAEGLPGSVGLVQLYNGEADIVLDHEAMRWGRSLDRGAKVQLDAKPPIEAVVKSVRPEREKTQVRLVVKSIDLAELNMGQRVHLKMKAPPTTVDQDLFPPDIDRPKTKEDRLEWFLASIYCTCGVKGNICTGHFYTLSSCNVNGCGAPNATRKAIAEMIDKGLDNRQIFERLHKERGPEMVRSHLLP